MGDKPAVVYPASGVGSLAAPSGNYMVAINARCLDGIDLSPIEVGHFDGRSL
jgi:hypothetical protein